MMPEIEHLQTVNVPAAAVYAALTTEAGLAEVWTRDLAVVPQVGAISEFRFGDEAPDRMRITELVENRRQAWHCVDSVPEWIGTDISFDLEETDGRTTVLLRHSNWREVTACFRSCNYNWAMFLYSLKQYCEDGEGLPFQKRRF
jgi:uncharacterized protein YndB with AHSA1/START domain